MYVTDMCSREGKNKYQREKGQFESKALDGHGARLDVRNGITVLP